MNFCFRRMPRESEGLAPPFFVSLSGDHEVAVSPCRRVLQYETNVIRMETVGATVEIRGDQLTLAAFHERDVTVKGLILSVSIERGA